MCEFLPSSVEIIYRNQLSRPTQFKVGITAMVAFTLQKAGLLLFSTSFFFFCAKKKAPVPEILILNMCSRSLFPSSNFKLQKLQYPLAALAAPVSLSCDSENAKGGAVCPVCPLPVNVFQDGA